jgi:serine/threonine protein kinase
MSELARYQDTPIGPYRLISLLGVGPVSRVYLAERQNEPGRQVALKLFESVPLLKLEEKDQALDEVRLLACMEHPALLPLLDDGLHENMLYLVMPCIRGDTLRQRLTAAAGNALPLAEALAIMRQAGEALHFAHTQQIVHANIKPENVFLPGNGKALLADFLLPSLARSERAARILSTFAALYMAPEQFQGTATPLSDQYALACLTYELLAGRAPFQADDGMSLARQHASREPLPPSHFQPACEPYIDHALLKALVKQPEGRYPDMQAFLADLSAPSAQVAAPLTVSSSIESLMPEMIEAEVLLNQESAQETPEVFDLETVKQPALHVAPSTGRQPALKTVSASVMTGVYEAVTLVVRAVRPKSLTGVHAQILPAPALAQQTVLRAHPRPLPQLSRRQIWLTASLVVLVLLISISGIALFFSAAAGSQTSPQALITAGSSATPSAPTSAASQLSPSATSAIGSVVMSGSSTTTPAAAPTAQKHSPTTAPTATATATPTATPTPTPTPKPTPTPTKIPSLSCRVAYKVTQQWPGNFSANLTIINTGSIVIHGWTLTFTFSNGQEIYHAWNGNFRQNGAQVSISDAGFNNTLSPGASTTPGIQATVHGQNSAPTSFALNGVPCQ